MAKKVNKIEGNFSKEEAANLTGAFNEVLKKAGSVEKAMKMINQSSVNYVKSLQGAKSELEKIAEKIEESSDYGSDLAYKIRNIEEANKDTLKTLKVQNFALQNNLKAKEAEAILARRDLHTQLSKAKLTNEQRAAILKEYDLLQKNLHLKEEEEELAERILEYDEERLKIENKIKANAQVLKDIITDQRAAAAVFIGQMLKGYDLSKELFAEVRKEGHTVTQAFHETGIAMSDAFSLTGASAKDSLEIMGAMRSEMGSVHHVTRETRLEAASLAKTFGLSNEMAGKLTAQFATMPGATAETANNTLEFAGNLAKAAGVAPGDVMKDIANSSEDVATYTKDGGKNIATAAVAAKKLGMEFGSLTKMADQLMDFETSINKQMEASVLLGKEINLDKAAQAAMNGDLVGMTQEVLANVGGEAEFNKMNFQQRKALAASIGVSVTDLGKMVKHQDELTNLTQEQQEALMAGETTMDEVLANTGGFVDKMKEGGKTVLSGVIGFGEMSKGIKDAGQEAKSLFGGFGKFFAGMKGGGGVKGGLKGALGMDKAKDGAEDAAGKSDKIKGGGGFKNGMKNLAAGFKQMGDPKVRSGITNIALAGPAMILGIAAVPFMAFVALLGTVAGKGLQGLSEGLKGKGMGAAAVAAGIGNLALFGLASIPAVLGLPFLIGVAMFGTLAGIGLKGLADGVKAFAKVDIKGILMLGLMGVMLIPAAYAFSLLADVPVENMIAFALMLPLLAIGVLALGAALAGPQAILFMLGIVALGMLGGVLILLGAGLLVAGLGMQKFAESAVKVIANLGPIAGAISEMASMVGPLSEIAAALLGIGAGLTFMAVAGFTAMPIIGMLIGLAAVAPALTGLAKALTGGGGEAEKNDKMDELIAEVRSLKTEMASITVNLDGKKVGDALRGSMNTSRVR